MLPQLFRSPVALNRPGLSVFKACLVFLVFAFSKLLHQTFVVTAYADLQKAAWLHGSMAVCLYVCINRLYVCMYVYMYV